ncbi:peptidoglycan DD-metalloendopeptidase family protein [Candidatus Pseudomonas adelgestsugas]|uniref:peptidoglycan DD-metalloendopeptidase family protein n=1 Tax=Candidatus Pseudomonas adelgestsugas TaxID=1302376 RepID=UPI00100DB47D|nr:peptidoglycan DD-metalloendopeptidase family protein [Candidatus Pseudomonas adelgestsugas]
MSKISFQRLIFVFVLSFLLTGCLNLSSSNARIFERNSTGAVPQQSTIAIEQYIVRKGDTMFSIALRYGWHYKVLATRNNIPIPYTIYPGQTICFNRCTGLPSATAVVTKSGDSVFFSSQNTIITRSAGTASHAFASKISPALVIPVGSTPTNWKWPSSGVLIKKFSSSGNLNKGIDIAGCLGQAVFAASDGTVVYAGSGLRGYGELVIIKHSNAYVSAYGHNRKLFVREGQQVKIGQAIAEMGSIGTNQVKLHFEIRHQGKPVDPLQFLPRC